MCWDRYWTIGFVQCQRYVYISQSKTNSVVLAIENFNCDGNNIVFVGASTTLSLAGKEHCFR